MNDELHDYLDGELSRAELPPEVLDEAEGWDRLIATLREDVPGPAPQWIENRVMAEIGEMEPQAPDRRGGFLDWFLRPRTLRANPLGIGVAALAALVLIVWPWTRLRPVDPGPNGVAADAVVYVQFVFDAPGVNSVAVSGDFNEWNQEHRLDDPDGDGIWTGRVAVRPGVHEYMFLVDGDRWVTDPRAERYVDDGFGNRNAILAVANPTNAGQL